MELLKPTLFSKLFALGLMLLASTARADELWFYNWLVGVSVGYGDRVGSLTVNTDYTPELLLPPLTLPGAFVIRDLADSGTVLSALVGYQGIYCQWLKGIELSVDNHSFSRSKGMAFTDTDGIIGYSGVYRYQRKWMGALSARIGYALTTTFMPYIRLGAELGSDRLTTSFSSPVLLDSLVVTNEQRMWVYRFLLGAGIEIPLYPDCGTTLRLEYDYHSKGRTLITESALYDGVYNPGFTSKAQPMTQSVRVVLVWNFF